MNFRNCEARNDCIRTIFTASLRDATLLCASFPAFRFAPCWAIILHSLREVFSPSPSSLFPIPCSLLLVRLPADVKQDADAGQCEEERGFAGGDQRKAD